MGLFDFVTHYIAAPITAAITGHPVPPEVERIVARASVGSFAANPAVDIALNFVPGGSTIQSIVNTAPTPSTEV